MLLEKLVRAYVLVVPRKDSAIVWRGRESLSCTYLNGRVAWDHELDKRINVVVGLVAAI